MEIDITPTSPEIKVAGKELEISDQPDRQAILGGALILTPAQLEQASTIAQELDLKDSNAVIKFGYQAQERSTKTAEAIIGQVRTKDTGEPAAEALTSLVGVVRGYGSKQFGGPTNIVGWLVAKVVDPAQKLVDRFDKSASQIDGIVTTLQKERGVISKDIQSMDNLLHDCMDQYKDLTTYIVAGKMRIETEREELEIQHQIKEGVDPLNAQLLKEKEESVELLERKVNDLELTRAVTLQAMPQIRMIQETDKMLLQKIDGSIVTTIPIWKTQVAMAITAFRQKQAIEMQDALTDATNKLLKDNANLVKENVLSGKKSLERGVIDIETLDSVSATLISAVTESIEITKAARKARADNSEKLTQLEGNLVHALTNTSTTEKLEAPSNPQLKE